MRDSAQMDPGKRAALIQQRIVDALKALTEQGIPVQEIARDVGVQRNAVYNWMATKTTPALENVAPLARRLGIPLSYLLADDEDELEVQAAGLLRQLGPAEKAAAVSKLGGWVEATLAAREAVAAPRPGQQPTKREPAEALVSGPGAAPPEASPDAQFPNVAPRRHRSPRKRPPA